MPAATYTADSIQALSGLAHVRHRPLMYLGSAGLGVAGLHHLIWEIVDNSVDEAMGGHGNRVVITLLPDGGVAVQDFGRGIPVDPMKEGAHKGRSALEVVLTETNAGGKFDSDSYKVSGGLHGVGASVVTGLSTRLDAEVWRDGRRFQLGLKLAKDRKGEFTPGVIDKALEQVGAAPRNQTGTTIRFWPDLALFRDDNGDPLTKPQWSIRLISERLRHKSFVHPGLTFELRDDRDPKNKTVVEFCSQGGVADLVAELTADSDVISPVLGFAGTAEEGTKRETMLHAAVAWTVDGRDTTLGYANGVANPEGGTHINGFRAAVTEAVQTYIADRGLLKDKEVAPTTKDIFAGAIAVVSIMIPEPAFAGNSKGKLMNPEAAGRTRAVVLPQMARWLEENPAEAKRVADGAIAVMRARTKSNADQLAAKALLAKGSKSRGGLPAKLRDCTRKTERATELLLVEGDSAGGTAIDARDPSFQAILPLRGKPLNSYDETLDRVVKSGTIADLILTLGCGIGEDYDIDKLRYQHVMVVADADKDGQHIRTLLTVFFYRWMPGLIESGRVLYAMPPLWSTVFRGERIYLADDKALAAFRAENPTHKGHVGRMKGLGEMDHRELRMVIGSGRTVGRVTVADPLGLQLLADKLFGPRSEARKAWFLERTGHTLTVDERIGAPEIAAQSTVTATTAATDAGSVVGLSSDVSATVSPRPLDADASAGSSVATASPSSSTSAPGPRDSSMRAAPSSVEADDEIADVPSSAGKLSFDERAAADHAGQADLMASAGEQTREDGSPESANGTAAERLPASVKHKRKRAPRSNGKVAAAPALWDAPDAGEVPTDAAPPTGLPRLVAPDGEW